MSKNESKPQAVDHVKNVPLINARMLVKRIIWKKTDLFKDQEKLKYLSKYQIVILSIH